ncbi:MAG: ABC transporter permease [Acidimicrobiales bacterium]|jgi:ribose transport system permease protein
MSTGTEGMKSAATGGLVDSAATGAVLSGMAPDGKPRPSAGRSKNVDVFVLWPIAVMVLIIIATSFTSSRFLSVFNFENILSQAAPLGIVTMGQCILLISGGLDLSVGYNISFSSIITGLLLEHNAPLGVAVLAGIACATAVGFVNGLLAAQGRAHPFIITLGMSIFLFGLDTQLTGGAPVNNMKGLYTAFGSYMPGGFPFFGLPSVTWPFVIVILLTYAFLRWAPLGRRAYAIGGNEQAAYLSGIPVKRTKIYLYTMMGALVGVTGMVLSGQINEASFNLAQNFELQSIACAVIGGTALFGGRGGAFRSLQGVALWGLVQNSILFIGFSSNYQQMALGIIIILAVMVTRVQR